MISAEPAKRRFEPVLAGAGRLFRPLGVRIFSMTYQDVHRLFESPYQLRPIGKLKLASSNATSPCVDHAQGKMGLALEPKLREARPLGTA